MILSQILRGIAEVTATAAAASGAVLRAVDANALGAALWRGVELVVASMGGVEVPGTIVSLCSHTLARSARAGSDSTYRRSGEVFEGPQGQNGPKEAAWATTHRGVPAVAG